MVKGSTRQVIVVKSPDPKLFEEAIFIVREEALKREGVTAEAAITQAKQAADSYLRRGRLEQSASPVAPLLWAAAGGIVTSLCWAAGVFLV